jgi:hypothetical protein
MISVRETLEEEDIYDTSHSKVRIVPQVDWDKKLAQSDNTAKLVFGNRDSNSKLVFVL